MQFFFDLDGTLTDSSPGIINSIIYALNKYGIAVENTDTLKPFLGPPLHESFKNFYDFDEEKAMQATHFYREYFSDKGIFENELYDGTVELLKLLKENGKALILATSKPQKFTDAIMFHFDITKYFDVIAGSNLDGTRSKKAEVIEYALTQSKTADLSKCVMIGDRKEDIIGAKKAGIDSIGVLYGYGDYDELNNEAPQYIAKSVENLKTLLLS
ncbi:MAG: HAD-IA family hydrolase [Clostridiales bacterium]|nr:HAD-IA family hydrolase [Clostridiales bacterium]